MKLKYKGYDKEGRTYVWTDPEKTYTVRLSIYYKLIYIKEYSEYRWPEFYLFGDWNNKDKFTSNDALKYLARYLKKT